MRARIELFVDYADALYRAFKPLEREMEFRRGRVKASVSDGRFIVDVECSDATSLRSLVNGVLKSIYLTSMVLELEDHVKE